MQNRSTKALAIPLLGALVLMPFSTAGIGNLPSLAETYHGAARGRG